LNFQEKYLRQQGTTNTSEKERCTDTRKEHPEHTLLDEYIMDIGSSLVAMHVPVHTGRNPLGLLLHGLSS
jgi:hypothetical protein